MNDELLTLQDIKNEPFVIEHILWEMEPKDIMEAKFKKTEHGVDVRDEIKGYIFYIESMGKEPQLFMMRHTAIEFAETMARIDDAPKELLAKAVEINKDRHYFGMYPIDDDIKAWLRNELGVK
ncbi:MAG TPA: hypothetical protein VK448_05640 [Dissulfurispiraceae bacterium]|nr:hypothetical protein [Dissulfurispiraceae bacterium]